jgi:hypothetical protein
MEQNEELGLKIFQTVPVGRERETMIDVNARGVEEMKVAQYYTQEELAAMRADYVQKQTEIAQLIEQLDKVKSEINGKLKPLTKDTQYALEQIRRGYVDVEEKVYLYDDQREGLMKYYNRLGELVYSRPLAPTERQTNVISMARAVGS